MKAKVIATGEIVDVVYHSKCVADNGDIYVLYKNTETALLYKNTETAPLLYDESELEFYNKEIDWEQRRFELIKAISVGVFNYPVERHERKIEDAIKLADAIIAKLKKEQS